jgi:hypothetical protein
MGNKCCQMCQGPLNPHSELDRRQTFPKDWQYYDHIALARLGFIYTGYSDVVQCVYCKFLMEADIQRPLTHIAHKNRTPKCPFVHGENVGNIGLPVDESENAMLGTLPAETSEVNCIGILDLLCSFVACFNIMAAMTILLV